MILSSGGSRLPDTYAIRYEDMHPVLQEHFDRLDRRIRNTFARLVHHAQDGELLYVREFFTHPIMCERCLEANIDNNKLAEDVIEYCNIRITENDIEYYLKGT